MAPLQNSALRLPQQDLEGSSFFECTIESVSAWADDLPLGSPARAGSSLRSALSELNRIPLEPQERYRLLEILRTPTHAVVSALIQACLNQPIILDDDSQIQSDVVADLCSLIAAGYTLVAVHTIQGSEHIEGINPARLACEALHRAVVHSGERIHHSYLLYQPLELNSWATLHQLYALAERQQLARLPVKDPVRDSESSIEEEYLAPLLLACSKPNQLRQHDIVGAYRAFQTWRNLAKLQDPELGEGLFAVDMNSDQPPVFAELLVRRGTSQFRYVNTKALVRHLEQLKQSRGSSGLHVIEFDRQTRLDANLLEHLIKSLGEISQRNFARQNSRLTLHIATGLSNVHYFVAGERTLQQVIQGENYDPADEQLVNPFLVPQKRGDKWQEANPEEDFEEHDPDVLAGQPIDAERFERLADTQDVQARDPVRHIVHSVKTTNTSPGGYCVEWLDPPDSIHIGDVVGVREADHEQADWTIAVIRWVSQVKNAPTLLGLELLSPRGSAYAAQVKMSNGDLSRPIRVLLLPEIPLVGQTHTLIVPRMVFREGQRINLTRFEDAFLVKLNRQVASTGYFSQMDFEFIRQLDEDIEDSASADNQGLGLSSIWNEI